MNKKGLSKQLSWMELNLVEALFLRKKGSQWERKIKKSKTNWRYAVELGNRTVSYRQNNILLINLLFNLFNKLNFYVPNSMLLYVNTAICHREDPGLNPQQPTSDFRKIKTANAIGFCLGISVCRGRTVPPMLHLRIHPSNYIMYVTTVNGSVVKQNTKNYLNYYYYYYYYYY